MVVVVGETGSGKTTQMTQVSGAKGACMAELCCAVLRCAALRCAALCCAAQPTRGASLLAIVLRATMAETSSTC